MEVLAPSPSALAPPSTPSADKAARLSAMRPHAAPRGSRRRARTTVAAAPSASTAASSAAATHLSGFFVRAVEPRESSYLHYTSLASPGTHTEYHISVSDVLAAGGGSGGWVVSRRYSAFLLLRDELLRGLSLSGAGAAPHCAHCGALRDELAALARELPRKRLWGSARAAVVRRRAAKFLAFLRALLALATNAARLRCPVVCFGFAVQVRTFLTRDSEPAPKPADERRADALAAGIGRLYFHHPVLGATTVHAVDSMAPDAVGPTAGRSLLAVAIREGDEDEEEEDEEEVKQQEEQPVVGRRGSYSLASTSRRSSMEDASSHTSTASSSRAGE